MKINITEKEWVELTAPRNKKQYKIPKNNHMIKLTKLHYKLKEKSLKRSHTYNQYVAEAMQKWEKEVKESVSYNNEYPHQPFASPFEFKDADFDIIEGAFRVRLENIQDYGEDEEGATELVLNDGRVVCIKETIEYLDKLFAV